MVPPQSSCCCCGCRCEESRGWGAAGAGAAATGASGDPHKNSTTVTELTVDIRSDAVKNTEAGDFVERSFRLRVAELEPAAVAPDDTVILLHPPVPLVVVSIGINGVSSK